MSTSSALSLPLLTGAASLSDSEATVSSPSLADEAIISVFILACLLCRQSSILGEGPDPDMARLSPVRTREGAELRLARSASSSFSRSTAFKSEGRLAGCCIAGGADDVEGVVGLDGVEPSDEAEVAGEGGCVRSETFRSVGFLLIFDEADRPRI